MLVYQPVEPLGATSFLCLLNSVGKTPSWDHDGMLQACGDALRTFSHGISAHWWCPHCPLQLLAPGLGGHDSNAPPCGSQGYWPQFIVGAIVLVEAGPIYGSWFTVGCTTVPAFGSWN